MAVFFLAGALLEGAIQIDDLPQVRPGQLCTQCVHNVFVRKDLREANHVKKIRTAEPPAMVRRQFSTQCVDNLLSIRRPSLPKDLLSNPAADVPVECDQTGVDRLGHLLASRFNQSAHVAE